MLPMRLAPVMSIKSLIWSSTGFMSETPAMLAATRPASSASVTALKTTAVEEVGPKTWASAWAEGVAIPTATSTLSLLNFCAIELAVEMSPLAFCRS
ncbi:MAG: hypothetical protein BWY50_02005 [Spirochaetes bacterium ADurb.Bin315]|nr:MAG: hypothetical protein BWY50_02005 [Spirochaetes bacterium ADurb.Bin315]